MATETRLEIRGYDGKSVPNRFLRPRGRIGAMAVLLPGYGYTLDMPLLYYAENALIDRGIDVLRVETAYNRDPSFAAATDDDQSRRVQADAAAAWAVANAQDTYANAFVVGKSLGTRAMAALLAGHIEIDPAVRAVWLTPLLAEPPVRSTIAALGGRSLVVIGDADPHHDPRHIADFEAAAARVLVLPGADHGLDIDGDPAASVAGLATVVGAMVRFFSA